MKLATSIIIFLIFMLPLLSFSQNEPADLKDNQKGKTSMTAIIQTPTNKLENSISFYEKLGFKMISRENLILYTDGKAIIEINPDRFARAGIKLYKQSWENEISKLKEITTLTNLPNGYLFSDPSGVWIYLIESEAEPKYKIEDSSFSVLGNFAGLSFETTDIQKSYSIYEILGFTKGMGSIENGFVTLSHNENFTIALMKPLSCPHLFFNPSMTYFNGKNNLAVIENIRKLNIPITEEITYFNKEGIVDNIIIRDPGGYGFFIFSD